MELVKGIPITQFSDEQGLGTKGRLGLFADVCAAVNHAHQKGIIHRDLKPSNVMVTLHGDKPVVKVIDFGIAKATQGKLTDMTLFTRYEQFIGTPMYMSPEQASLSGLDIDTRSDIYALGVLLYELLTGKPPFDGRSLLSAGYDEMRRIIREVEPPKPSSRLSTVAGAERTQLAKARRVDENKLRRLVEPDLDWIVMKAIDKDRARRYETANAFAQDIGRFLADEPVSATPPSAGYRFRKFARRSKATIGVAALTTFLLVGGILVSTWQAVRAMQAKEQMIEERDAKDEALKDAKAVSEFIVGMLGKTRPGVGKGGIELKVVDVLDDAVAELDANPAMLAPRRALLQATLASTYGALGRHPQAIKLQEKVRDYHLATSGPEHPATLLESARLAQFYYGDGDERPDEAILMQEELLPPFRKVFGEEHRDTLGLMMDLANSYTAAQRPEEAILMQEALLPLFRKLYGAESFDTMRLLGNLALANREAGRWEKSLEMREQVLALFRKVLGPEHPDTLNAMIQVADSYDHIGRLEEALKLQEEVLALHRKVLGPEHSSTLSAMNHLVNSYCDAGRLDKAIEMGEQLLELASKVLGPEHRVTAYAKGTLALCYSAAGRLDEALALDLELLEYFSKARGPEHHDTIQAMTQVAGCYHAAHRYDEAVEMMEKALALYRKELGPEDGSTLNTMSGLADLYQEIGRMDEAIAMREELLELCRKVRGPEDDSTLNTIRALAELYQETGRMDEAIAKAEELLELCRQVRGPEHPGTAAAAAMLGFLLDQMGPDKNAYGEKTIAAWLEAVRIDPKDANTHYFLARKLVFMNRLEEALVTLRAAGELYPDGPRGLEVRERLVKVLADLGREQEAEEVRLELATLATAISENSPPVRAVLVAPTSEWKWLHPLDGTDPNGSDPDFHQTFFTAGYDDASWQTGKDSDQQGGGFGYGDEWFTGVDIGSPKSKDVGKSAYFRHRFTTDQEHPQLELRCQRDDGLIIYLDGKEVARHNMGEGEEAYLLPALDAVSDDDETTTYRIPLPDLTLPAGKHVLAISMHNTENPSSDLRIGGISLVEAETPKAK